MADTEKQIIILEGTRPKTLYTKVEEGKLEDGTSYEKRQAVSPRGFTTEITDSKGRNLDVRLDEMQEQLDGVSTDISATIETAITERTEDDIATKEELKYNNVEMIKNGNYKLNTNGLSEYIKGSSGFFDSWNLFTISANGVISNIANNRGLKIQSDASYNSWVYQAIESGELLAGKTITITARVKVESDGEGVAWFGVDTGSGTLENVYFDNTDYKIVSLTVDIPNDATAVRCKVGTGSFSENVILYVDWISLKPIPYVTEYTEPDTELEKVRCEATDFFSPKSLFVGNIDELYNTTDNGVYWCSTNDGTTGNIPAEGTAFFILSVEVSNDGLAKHTFYQWDNHRLCTRMRVNNTWLAWSEVAKTSYLANYLPLTGGMLSNSVVVDNGKDSAIGFLANRTIGGVKYTSKFVTSFDKGVAIQLLDPTHQTIPLAEICFTSGKCLFGLTNNNIFSHYTVLHTGNSKPLAVDTSAPTDTTAVWIDKANKVVKAYIDGAWTAVS